MHDAPRTKHQTEHRIMIIVTHSQTVTLPNLGLLGVLETMSDGTVCLTEAEDDTTWSFNTRDEAIKAIMKEFGLHSISEITFGYNVAL